MKVKREYFVKYTPKPKNEPIVPLHRHTCTSWAGACKFMRQCLKDGAVINGVGWRPVAAS